MSVIIDRALCCDGCLKMFQIKDGETVWRTREKAKRLGWTYRSVRVLKRVPRGAVGHGEYVRSLRDYCPECTKSY